MREGGQVNACEHDTIYSNEKNQDTAKDTMSALGQEIAGSYQKSQGIDITTDRDQHNNYQNMVAQDTIDDLSFLSNNYGLGINLNTVNNHNTNLNQVTSTPSVFNSQTANNNIEFAGLDKSQGDNFSLPSDYNFGLTGLSEWFSSVTSGAVEEAKKEAPAAASVALAAAGGVPGIATKTAWTIWGVGAALDIYSTVKSGDAKDAVGIIAVPPTGKAGTAFSVANSLNNLVNDEK